jgi:NAD-reducing hydrogenase large subunit
MYRVGPLARLNNCDRCGTPFADVALAEFRTLQESRPVASSFPLSLRAAGRDHLRLGEIDRLAAGSGDPGDARPRPGAQQPRRGHRRRRGAARHVDPPLPHRRRRVDDLDESDHRHRPQQPGDEPGVKQVAQQYVDGNKLQEGMLNRVEALIRCFDPCLSCASHAFGQMPMHIECATPLLQEFSLSSRKAWR